jgi:small-conductance mechanosensitive channel
MRNPELLKKIKRKIEEDESKLNKRVKEIETIWEKTDLDPNDQLYLVEKTMRFEIAQNNITRIISLFKETINDYKILCAELEKSEES